MVGKENWARKRINALYHPQSQTPRVPMEGLLVVSILTAVVYLYLVWSQESTMTGNVGTHPLVAIHSRDFRKSPGLNTTTCLWVHFKKAGRSGNKIQQLQQVKNILSRCSGVASSDPPSNGDPILAFPPVLFATQGGLDDPSTLLALAAQECQEVTYQWGGGEVGRNEVGNCSSESLYNVSIPVDLIGSSSPALLANVFAEHAFWKQDIATLDTMVMYFRGGDILQEHAHTGYSQGPCSLFLESWYAANVSRAVLVYDPNDAIHPCIELVRGAIGNSSIVQTPCDSARCHMMTLGRARYVVVSGITTFAQAGFALFPGRRRVIFRYFCGKRAPHESQVGLEICVDGSSEGLKPWSYTNKTRSIMMERPSQVVLGHMNASSFQQYLQQGDGDQMASRFMLL